MNAYIFRRCDQSITKLMINMEKKWAFSLLLCSFLCIFALTLVTSLNLALFLLGSFSIDPNAIRSALHNYISDHSPPPPPPPRLPRFAYYISGSKGELEKLLRTLQATYHPLNHYILHMDLECLETERSELVSRVANDRVFAEVGNVLVVTKANMVTYTGPTMVSNVLHGCAMFLKMNKDWDWFINLSASDYPLVTQDDLIHTFSKLDRNLNFVEHTSKLGWKENGRGKPVMLDPGIYSSRKSDVFFVKQNRDLPTAFKVYTGSFWMVLSRPFVEYTIMGWENLPRTLLMYFTNYVSSSEGYFTTLICNVPSFSATAVNHDLHYIAWNTPPKQHPLTLSLSHFDAMLASDAPFARKFGSDLAVLDRIDKELLGGRRNGSFTPGGWCSGHPGCDRVGNPEDVRPGGGAERLGRLIDKVVYSEESKRDRCK